MPTPALRYSRYCEGCDPNNPPKLVPVTRFLAAHFISRSQLKRLARQRVIVAKKFKGQNWVAMNPQIEAQNLTLEDFL